METLKKWGKGLVSWVKGQIKRFVVWAIVNPWKAFRKWLNKSRFVAFVVGAAIFGSFTFCFMTIKYEYKEIFNSRVVIFNNTSVALASTERESAGANQVVEKVASPEVRGEEQSSPTVQIIQKIAKEEGIDWKLVYAVCLKESGCNPEINCEKQYGRCDDGQSFGAYQIYNPTFDPKIKRLAENFEEATRWTIKHGYRFKDDPALFFKNHNGLYKITNQWYVDGAMDIYKTL